MLHVIPNVRLNTMLSKKHIDNLSFQTFQPYLLGENMFDHVFSNGTGTRCWVAGIMF